MTKVLLLRADAGSANLGVRVLKEGTEALLRRALGSNVVVHVQNFNGGDTGEKFNREAVLRDVGRKNGPITSVLRRYDIVIDVCGGDSFTDIYGLKRLALILYTQRASQRLDIPTVLGPQTIGPFTHPLARRLAAASLKRMRLVISRDRASTAEAALLGRSADLAATDVVFALPVPVASERRGIVLNVSGLLWYPNVHVDHGAYRDAVRRLVRVLVDRGDHVTLLAHVLDNPRKDNDVLPLRELETEFRGDVTTVVPASLSHAREVIASSELVVGARMHACLNAISTGTPAIPWAYSRKFAPLLADIGWEHLVDLRDDLDPVDATLDVLDRHDLRTLGAEAAQVQRVAAERLQDVVMALAGLVASHG